MSDRASGLGNGGDRVDESSSVSRRRLETDEDIARVLQQRYPPLDDPAAREAIVARFANRGTQTLASQRNWPCRRNLVRGVVLVAALGRLIAVWRRSSISGDKSTR